MERPLQVYEEQQDGRFGHPFPGEIAVEELKSQHKQPGEKQIAAPGNMPDAVMRDQMTVEVE